MFSKWHIPFFYVALAATGILCRQAEALRWNTTIGDGVTTAGDPVPQHSDRFYGDPDFVGTGFDWSGVGISQGAIADGAFGYQGTWVTMISDTYFLSAYHAMSAPVTAVNVPINFYATNDIGDGYEQLTTNTASWERIDGTDLMLGRLTSPPTSAIARYPLIKRQDGWNYPASPTIIDPKILIVGYADTFSNYNYFRVGLNDINYLGKQTVVVEGVTYTDAQTIGWTQDASSTYGVNEATTIGGDSSGPAFAVAPTGKLGLVGINWEVDNASAVSSYTSQIAAKVALGGEHVVIMTDQLGDFNGDYKVTSGDYGIFQQNYNQGSGFNYNDGDINGDGQVTSGDYGIFQTYYGMSKFAPSDFDQNGSVDKDDMVQIGNHWHQSVTAHTNGDANGNGYVDGHDIDVLNDNFGQFVIPTPTSPDVVDADLNKDWIVDSRDLAIWNNYQNVSCNGGNSWCKGADIDHSGAATFGEWGYIQAHFGNYIPADINADGYINNTDLNVILNNWGQSLSGKANGDVNNDGIVDVSDFEIMAEWWGYGNALHSQATPAVVPEPTLASFAVFLLVALNLASGRIRN
jgi:hypothetical protein